MVGCQGRNVFSVYLVSGRNVHHRKTPSSKFQAGLEVLKPISVLVHITSGMMKKNRVCVHSQLSVLVNVLVSFFSLITGVDLPTLFKEEVLPPPLLYLPGMQFELCLFLDSLDLGKLSGS